MNKLIALLLICFAVNFTCAQENVEELVQEGISHHDNGDYDLAIESYKRALKINPAFGLAHYEVALSYFSKGLYKETIRHADEVLELEEAYELQAYLIKSAALDMLGKTKNSNKLLKRAIIKFPEEYLLYYNLALNYFKVEELDLAEANVLKAIEVNPTHSSSHLLLANVHQLKGNTVQTLLATHHFLFLEPNSVRSSAAYEMMMETFGGNVTQDTGESNNINILLSSSENSEFSAVELMISMLAASNSMEENADKTEEELFVSNTASFFKILGELKKEDSEGIWWDYYTSFYYELAQSEHLEAYCMYISQSESKSAARWLSENEDKLIAFDAWLNEE